MILQSRLLSWLREKRKFDSHSMFLSILILSVSFFLFLCFFFLLCFLFVCLSVVAFFIITVIIFASQVALNFRDFHLGALLLGQNLAIYIVV